MDKSLESHRLYVFKYYNKSENDVQNDINMVLTALEKLAHFPKINDEIAFRKRIEAFLVFNKFSIEKTKNNLVLCYLYRNIYPDFFDNWDPCTPEFENGLATYRYVPLPKLTQDLNRITLIYFCDKFADNFSLITCIKIFLMSLEIRIPYDRNTGNIIIHDFSRANMSMIKHITPTFIKKSFDIHLKGYCLRFTSAHILYPPKAGMFVLGFLKAILKPKLFERIHLHNDLESLHKVVPKECLPNNYGGNLPNTEILTDEWYDILKKSRINLIEESRMRTDESMRIDKLNVDDYFGSMHGSFKKLDVD